LQGQEVVLYGEPLFAAVVAEGLGITLLEPPFDWLPTLPEEYRQRDVCAATLEEARQLRHPAFIKPADDKCFPAAVYPDGSRLPGDAVLPGETVVLIAEPVRWEVEFRCFVREREVVTLSPYLRNGELVRTPDGRWEDSRTELARAFAARVVSDRAVASPAAVVVDVGLIVGRGWAVVEANAAWGSGIYGCDPIAVLNVVRRACRPQEHPLATATPEQLPGGGDTSGDPR
jgi:hypothetical protein